MRKFRSKISRVSTHRRESKPCNYDNSDDSVIELLQDQVVSFSSPTEVSDAFAKRFHNFNKCKVVLIGDSTHGTSEFYAARAEITKYLIERHGFNIVAVEADWPDAEAVDRYVRHRVGPGKPASVETTREAERAGRDRAFLRFPTWMWRNLEVHDFVEWLREHNRNLSIDNAAGFYGLDLYSLGASMRAVISYLDKVDRDMANLARDRYGELMMWAETPHKYGLETVVSKFEGYEAEVVDMLKDLLEKRLDYSTALWGGEEFHGSEQNARLVKDAERYYKIMYCGRRESWNLRVTHMFETLERILEHRGNSAKAIVWAHNSHVGDARASSNGWARREINIGQLCKETFGARGALTVGCSTYKGTVAAAGCWNQDMRIMRIQPALYGSYEQLMHATGIGNFVLDMRNGQCNRRLREALKEQRLERYIGVVYKPDTERQTHYSFAILPEQFDCFTWLDETRHVGALEVHQPPTTLKSNETWPFSL
ncbi:erythromycin esterase-domain-containing protein [Hypomontagnella monticulosa]|nr:erythromycin esterase-domain-containing protein [Hypomontagnella monticulosa]